MNKTWYGKEIEGRLYGLDTLFISSQTDDLEKFQGKFHHFLIGTSLIDELETNNGPITWSLLQDLIDTRGKYITLEVRQGQMKLIPHSMKLKCHILYWIDAPELSEMKSTDSVKLCIQNHDMYVYTLFNGQRVKREDYQHDRYDI